MDDPHTMEAALAGDLLTSEGGMALLTTLADRFGGRAAGSPDEAAAAAYLTRALLDITGAPPLVRRFRYQGWRRGEDMLALVAPLDRDLPAISLPGCPSAELEAELVSIGAGEEADLAAIGAALAGKVALCGAEAPRANGQPPSHRRVKYLRAVAAGAVAFLYVGRNPGMLAVTGGLAATEPAPIPGFGLALETGAYLERLLAGGTVRLRLRTAHRHELVSSENLIAEVPGQTDEVILVGAHYDGHDIAQAATDNGSGTAVLLELVRAVARRRGQLRRGVRFCLWGSEEAGLLGSWHYARIAGEALDPVVWVLNLDSLVNGPPGRLRLRAWPPPAGEAAAAALRAGSLPVELGSGLSSDSDHFPFAAAGLPVLSVGAAAPAHGLVGRGWGHTVADTVDKVDPAALAFAAATVGRILVRLSESTPSLPRLAGGELEAALGAAGRLQASRRWQELHFQ